MVHNQRAVWQQVLYICWRSTEIISLLENWELKACTSKRPPNGIRPCWNYWHGHLDEILSFKMMYHTWHKSKFKFKWSDSWNDSGIVITIQNRPVCRISCTLSYVEYFYLISKNHQVVGLPDILNDNFSFVFWIQSNISSG